MPARNGLAEHQKGPYPLAGAHLAVPCVACHSPLPASARPRTGSAKSKTATTQALRYRFPDTACASCHRDPHAGDAERWQGEDGCLGCHRLESWRAVRFDHGRTRTPLDGAHARVACSGCHRPAQADGRTLVRLTGAPTECAGCHQDPHAGQLPGDCARCHRTAAWKPSTFDHDRDAAYRLEGAHRGVACAACHPAERRGDRLVVRYKPLPTECASCHRSTPGRTP